MTSDESAQIATLKANLAGDSRVSSRTFSILGENKGLLTFLAQASESRPRVYRAPCHSKCNGKENDHVRDGVGKGHKNFGYIGPANCDGSFEMMYRCPSCGHRIPYGILTREDN